MKLRKILLGSSLLIPATVLPTTTLSSCSNSWGTLTPFTIGSSLRTNEWSPWYGLSGHSDADGKIIEDYLQSNYSVKTASSTNYAYSSPMKFVDNEGDEGQWINANNGWYTSSDSIFVASATENITGQESKTVTNAQNVTLSGNIDIVGSVGTTIENYLSLALAYQGSQLKAPAQGQSPDESDLKAAWGSTTFNHGGQEGDQARQFYEFVFANANLNGGGVINTTLKTTRVGFNFEQLFIPSYEFDSNGNRNLSADFIKLLEGTSGSLDSLQYYSTKSDEKTDSGEDKYITYTYEAVPVKVTVKGIEKRYVDTSKGSSSFLANDYYSDINQLNNLHNNPSSMWKEQLGKFVKVDEGDIGAKYKSYKFSTNGNISVQTTTDHDERITNITGNEFIVLVNYQVNVYSEKTNKNSAIVTSLADVFPAYLLSNDQATADLYKTANEDSGKYIIDINKVNNVTKRLVELIDISNTDVTKIHASRLDNSDKLLLKFLTYMFGTGQFAINTDSFITTTEI